MVRPDGGVSGVFDDNSRVVTDPVLSPVLIPSIVHSEPAPVPRVGLVLPASSQTVRRQERGLEEGEIVFSVYLLTTGTPSSVYSEKFSLMGFSTLY